MKKEDFKKLYDAIYSVTLEVSRLIKLDDLDAIGSLLNIKDELIKRINEAKSTITLSEEEKKELNSFIANIKELEDKNLQTMESKYEILKKKISNTNKESKALSSYKVTKEIAPAIIDKRGA